MQSFPNVTLDVHFVDSEQAHEKVLAGDLEFGFFDAGPPKLDERLQCVTIWEDPLVFVAAPFHPLAQMQNATTRRPDSIPKFTACVTTLTASQITLAEFAEKQGLKPKITISNNPLDRFGMLASMALG